MTLKQVLAVVALICGVLALAGIGAVPWLAIAIIILAISVFVP